MEKTILILNTGGTLSSVMKENGLAPGLTTTDIQKELHMVSQGVNLEMQDFWSVDSANIFPEDIPVVLTGSQLSMADPVADAMENLRCAIHFAATGCAGVYVAFNRKVMLGCRTSKVRSLSFDAFDSINYPEAARISSLGMRVNEAVLPRRSGVFHLENAYSDRVFLLKMFPGIHREILRSLAGAGYQGIYIEAYGMGGMPFLKHDFIAEIADLTAQGITVLVGTQCRYEGSTLSVYETGRRALEAGCLQAFDMTGEAALTKLMWVLGKTKDPQEIRDYFSVSLCREVSVGVY